MIKEGSHLEGVEPINEKIIKNEKFLNLLREKIDTNTKTFNYIKNLINNRDLYDKSGYSGSSVLIVKKDEFNLTSFVIKIVKNVSLYDEYIAYNYFYKLGYTSKPINYFKEQNYEIMITEFLDLPTAGFYFNSYEDIAKFVGRELRKFHDKNLLSMGFTKKEKNVFEKKFETSFEKAISNNTCLVYMTTYMGESDILKMKDYLIKNKNFLYKNPTLVHGDFNPNNIFVDKNGGIKFIDFCDSGICNKHYDIFWTMFMLIIFSGILKDKEKTKNCEEIFLTAYGKNEVNDNELKFFKYFASLYWKQHDEITRFEIL